MLIILVFVVYSFPFAISLVTQIFPRFYSSCWHFILWKKNRFQPLRVGECWIRLGFWGLFLCLLTWMKSDLLSFPVCFSFGASSRSSVEKYFYIKSSSIHAKRYFVEVSATLDSAGSRKRKIFFRQYKQINQLEHDLLTDAWKFHLEKCYVCKNRRFFGAMRNKRNSSLGIIMPD